MQGVLKKRNYGIDLLKIMSMVMIVVLHVCLAGGIFDASSGLTHKTVLFLAILCFCCVNCFALISGYVGYKKKNKLSQIGELWLQVFLYNILIYIVFLIFGKLEFSWNVLKEMLFPVFSNRYWYFTAYFGLIIFRPALNFLLTKYSNKDMKYILIGGFILLSICPLFFENQVLSTNNGYSLWWLMYLYLVGGYIKKNECLRNLLKRN